MKYTFTLLACLIFSAAFSQGGTWTWMHGRNVEGGGSVCGQMGVAAPDNMPRSLADPCHWTDLDGNFWVFGGISRVGWSVYGTLWKFDPQTTMWTWVKGDTTWNQPAVWGTVGVPSVNNQPPGRSYGSHTWVDEAGDLWMFGGSAFDANGAWGFMNDLWRYHIATNEWTWMGGSKFRNNAGSQGTVMVESATNWPSCRSEAHAMWKDTTGNIWIYGGQSTTCDKLADMWRLNTANLRWTWMSGAHAPPCDTIAPVYGTQMVEAPGNTPGSRWSYCTYTDPRTNYLYLFGGYRLGTTIARFYNDVWRYNTNTNQWAWVAGPQTANSGGQYSQYCQPAGNWPYARTENSTTWSDGCGHFWNYGGNLTSPLSMYSADLWMFDVNTNLFSWVSGSYALSYGNYGSYRVASPTNTPPSVSASAAFKDNNGNLWMFGGYYPNSAESCNTMWKFTLNASCIPPSSTVVSPVINYTHTPSMQCLPYTVNFQNNYNTPGAVYHWDFGVAGNADTSNLPLPTFSYIQPGNYTVTLSVQNPLSTCGETFNTVNITVNVPAPPAISHFSDTTICKNTPVIIGNAVPGYQTLWNTGDTTDVIIVNAPGTYWVEISDNNCAIYDSIIVTQTTLQPIAPWFSDTTICAGSSIVLNATVANATYAWSANETSATITVVEPGTYTVLITANGCDSTFAVVVDTVKCETGINNTYANTSSFVLYPNPTSNNVSIAFNDTPLKPYTIQLYSIDGKLLSSIKTKEQRYELNLDGIDGGLYFVKITQNGFATTQKLCVVK